MKIYIAAQYCKRHEINDFFVAWLKGQGHEVVSGWLEEGRDNDHLSEMIGTPYVAINERVSLLEIAERDLLEIDSCDTFIMFSGGGRGGRHFEAGYAMAKGKRMVIIGQRETIFHYARGINYYPDIASSMVDLAD